MDGQAVIDLTWTATSKLLSGHRRESTGEPGVFQTVFRLTGAYRDVQVTGHVTLPGEAPMAVDSDFGVIFRNAIGTLDLYVTRGH